MLFGVDLKRLFKENDRKICRIRRWLKSAILLNRMPKYMRGIMKVSVYCLAYNHEKYIRSALEGFVNQKTNFDYEVIVHDDASTDNTASIIREYAERYPNIIKPIFQTDNQCSQGVRIFDTFIFPRMSGEYIASCEGDDYWIDENKLQIQADFLDSHPKYSACVHNSYKVMMRTQEKAVMYGERDYDIQTPQVLVGGGACYHTSSLMFRKEYATNRPEFYYNTSKKGFGDYPLSIFLTLCGPIRYFGRIMSVYRIGTESSWTKMNMKNLHRNAVFHRSVSQMLLEVNEYTKYVHNRQIEKLILENNYMELYYDEKYADMRKPEYRELYEKESLQSRIKMRLKQYFKPIYRIYRKIKYQ